MQISSAGRTLRTGLKIAVSVCLLALLFSQVDWARAAPLVLGVHPLAIIALIAIYSADRVLMALKWHQLLHVLDTRLSRIAAVRVYYESTFVGLAMPLGGLGPDIVRYVRLRRHVIPSHVTLVSILMERYIGLVAMLTLVVVGFAVLSVIAPGPALARFARVTAAGALVGGLATVLALLIPALRRTAWRLLAKSQRIRGALHQHATAAGAYASRGGVLAVNFGLSLLEQTTPIWTYWVGSRALGTPLPLAVCVAVAPVIGVITRLPISYGGLGLREGSAAALLVALGYDYSESLVLLLLLFVMFFVSLLPGAVIFKRSPPAEKIVPDTCSPPGEPNVQDARPKNGV